MNYTDVDAERVLNTMAQIAGDISGMAKNRDVFKSGVISVLDVYWRGQAKDNFTAQFSAFTTAFESFVKDCEALNYELDKAANGYDYADDNARQLVNRLPR